MHLHELMGWPGPMTHRQYDAWQEWLDRQWDQPDRADHYAMQICREVKRVLHKKPDDVQTKDFIIPFKRKQAAVQARRTDDDGNYYPHPLSKEEAIKYRSDISKANVKRRHGLE